MIPQDFLVFGMIHQVPHFSGVCFHINPPLFTGGVREGGVLVFLRTEHPPFSIFRHDILTPVCDGLAFSNRTQAFADKVFRDFDPGIVAERRQNIESGRNEVFVINLTRRNMPFIFGSSEESVGELQINWSSVGRGEPLGNRNNKAWFWERGLAMFGDSAASYDLSSVGALRCAGG